MRIDPGGRTIQGISTLITFVVLNVLYLVCCLPLVTIGVATSALYEVTFRYADEERGNLLKDFFVALWRNLAPATAVFLTLLLPVVLLAFSGLFWSNFDSWFSWAAAILSFLAVAYLVAAILYGMALVASFRNRYRQTVKNALLFPVVEPALTLGILLLPVTTACLMVIFPSFLFIVGTIGFSVGAYASAFMFRRAFRRHGEEAPA